MPPYHQSGLSPQSIPYPITWKPNGQPSDPTGTTTVQFAFMLDDQTKPGSTDWHAGTWETWSVSAPQSPYVAVTPTIGPGGTVTTLTARPQPYWPWIQILQGATVVHVEQLPPIYID